MRNPEKEKELAKLPGVVLFPLDITSPQQIESAVTEAVAQAESTSSSTTPATGWRARWKV